MIQTAIYNRNGAYAGTKVNSREFRGKKYNAVAGIFGIAFGLILMAADSALSLLMQPYPQKVTLTTDLVSGVTITGKVVINGVEHTVTRVFSASHSGTLGSLRTDILALASDAAEIASVTVVGDVITIEPTPGNLVYFKDFSASGSGAPTINYGITRKLIALSKKQAKERNSDGTVKYNDTEEIDGVLEGEFWAVAEDADIDPSKDDVYVRIVPESGKIVGALKKSADSGKAIAAPELKFTSQVVDGLIAVDIDF